LIRRKLTISGAALCAASIGGFLMPPVTASAGTTTVGPAASIQLTVDPALVRAGAYPGTATLSATVLDAHATAVQNEPVTFGIAIGGDATVTTTPVPTLASGTATGTLTAGSSHGLQHVTATDAHGHTATMPFTQYGAPRAVSVTVAPGTVVSDGSTTSTATITVTDAAEKGNPVPGEQANIVVSRTGTSTAPGNGIGTVTDNHDGTYTATITSTTKAGPETITAADGEFHGSATLTALADGATNVVVTLEKASMTADGTSTQRAIATVTDANGNPRVGDHVTFSSTASKGVSLAHSYVKRGDLTFSNPAVGDQLGRYSVLVTASKTADVESIIATDSPADNQARLFTGGDGTAVAQWVPDEAAPSGADTDGQAIRLNTTPGDNWSGVSLLGVPATPPTTPPDFWFKANTTATNADGDPQLIMSFVNPLSANPGHDSGSIVLSLPNGTEYPAGTWMHVDGTGQWNSLGDPTGTLIGCGRSGTDTRTYAEMLTCRANAGDTVSQAFVINKQPSLDVNVDDISYGTGVTALVTQSNGGAAVSAPVTLTETAGPVTSITLEPSSDSVAAGSTAPIAVTATVTDVNGNRMSDQAITVKTDGNATIEPASGVALDNHDGTYTVSVTPSTTAGTDSITASNATGVSSAAFLLNEFGADGTPALHLGTSLVSINGPPVHASARVVDSANHPVSGIAVTFGSPDGLTFGTTPPTVTTDANGVAVIDVQPSGVEGPKTVKATANGKSSSQTLTQYGHAVTATISVDPATIVADGASQTLATVTLKDSSGDGVPGDAVMIQRPSCTWCEWASDTGDGTYTTTFTSLTTAGTEDITFIDCSSNALTTSIHAVLTETNGPATRVVVTPSPTTMPTDGISTSPFSAHVTDAHDNPVPGDTVTFTSSGDITFPTASLVTDASGNTVGTATAGTTVEASPETVTATDSATEAAGTASVTEVAGPATKVVVSADPSSVHNDGATHSTVTATVEDANGNPVLHAGDALTIVASKGTLDSAAGTTDSHGMATATLTASTTVGPDTITVTDTTQGVSGTATVTETARPSTTVLTSTTANPSKVGQAVVLDATVSPSNSTGTVTFMDGATSLGTSPSLDLGKGSLTTSSLAVGTHTITAVYSGDGQVTTSTSDALSQVVDPVVTTVVVTPHSRTLSANGTSNTTVIAVLTDTAATNVSGDEVTFTSSPENGVTFGTVSYHNDGKGTGIDGTATVTMTSGTNAGTVTVTATENTGGTSGTATEKLKSSKFRAGSFTLSQSSIAADGTSQTTASALVVDENNNPVAGEVVTFANDNPNGATVGASAVTGSDGRTSSVLTSSRNAGTNHITASSTNTDPNADTAAAGTFASSALTLTETAVSSSANFVHAAYHTMLGHQDAAGEAYWVAQLDSHGVSRSTFASVLASSPEYRTSVIGGSAGIADFYQLYLDRTGDAAGVNYWVGRMAGIGGSPLTFEQVRLAFAGSSEYFTSSLVGNSDRATAIEALYQDLLGRPSDTSGMTYWMSHFNTSAIAAQFLYSQEGRSFLVNSVYHSILGRSADAPGLSNWTNTLLSGASDETIIASILGSDEYFLSH
jgi:adhesin/invasin